jgi:hypothetical protein
MRLCGKSTAVACACAAALALPCTALAAEPASGQAPSNGWQFSFTPYAWATSVNGSATVHGHKADINDSFIQILEKSDSLLAWMSYFEARKGPFGLFTDVVWEDLGFPGHAHDDFERSGSFRPARFPNVVVSADANLAIKAHTQADYQSLIVQSGAAYEVAKWSGAETRTALDVLAGARYWNQDLDLSVHLKGDLNVKVTGEATIDPRDILKRVLEARGFKFNRRGAKLLQRVIDRRFGPGGDVTLERTVAIEVEKALAFSRSGDAEWVDPFVGFRLRHQMGPTKELSLEGDVGGFGAGSDFSWQVVAAYGFDSSICGTPYHGVIGYRALSVDFTEDSRNGKNTFDFVQHGPIMGVSFRW